MNRLHYMRLLLWIGLAASVVTVIGGELPIGWTQYPAVPGDPTGMLGMLIGSGRLSLVQLACGVFFGGIGIPLQYYGFKALYILADEGRNDRAAKIIRLGAKATAGLGGIVHVLCTALMFLCRGMETAAVIPQPILDFLLWLVLPVCVAFMPLYYAMCIALLITVARGCTRLPRWAAVFNPLTAALICNALPLFLPALPLVNALNMASMGLGSVLTFGGILILLYRGGTR